MFLAKLKCLHKIKNTSNFEVYCPEKFNNHCNCFRLHPFTFTTNVDSSHFPTLDE